MAGDVADPDAHFAVDAAQHVVVIAANLRRRLHKGGDVQPRHGVQFVLSGQDHSLQTAGDVDFGPKAQIFRLSLVALLQTALKSGQQGVQRRR